MVTKLLAHWKVLTAVGAMLGVASVAGWRYADDVAAILGIQPKIHGGTQTSVTTYPYIIALVTGADVHKCAGVLLTSEWVLTAGHCTNVVTAIANTEEFDTATNKHVGGDKSAVDYQCVRKNYDTGSPGYIEANGTVVTGVPKTGDLSLIKLSAPFKGVTVASLANLGSSTTYAVGWGKTETGTSPDWLMHADVSTVSDATCNKQHKLFAGEIVDEHLCFGTGGTGSCNGDSGGPIVESGNVVAIISDGSNKSKDCNANKVWSTAIEVHYADATVDYKTWISDVTAGKADDPSKRASYCK